jgi:eukaryotic-like serine/threonine-protein kinase
MTAMLKLRAGQFSEAGPKPANEDSCGIRIPDGPLLQTKGVAAVIADGMSGSEAGREAAEVCVLGFLADYYSTPESWSVKKSVEKVLTALNHWLCGQGWSVYGSSRGMVTTVSVLVIKSSTAYLFHVGDTRIYRLRGKDLECLTQDHRVLVSSDKHYLARAMGIDVHLGIECRTVPLEAGDLFILTTDGVHDFLPPPEFKEVLDASADPETTVREIVLRARKNGSGDNLTCQMLCIDRLPIQDKLDLFERLIELPFPPPLAPGMVLDGYRILRELHASNRTQIYLAEDEENREEVVLKTPSVNFEDDADYIERFLQEEWVARRLNSPHILRMSETQRRRSCLYYVTEYLEGQTLRQWIRDHPKPSLTEVRSIVEQIAAGLRAFHQMDMLHQDLKPENVMIDAHGTVKLIDFGSSKIAGIEEIAVPWDRNRLPGTRSYTAPECVEGYPGGERADLFSLGVITYEMITGKLPYGEEPVPRRMGPTGYIPAARSYPGIPLWIDGALRKAVRRDPEARHEVISEFIFELSNPNPAYVSNVPRPLLERNPVAFWRGLALILLAVSLVLIYYLSM